MLTRLFRTESFRLTAIFAGITLGAILILLVLVYIITHAAFYAEVRAGIAHDLNSIDKGYQSEGVSEAKEVIQQRMFRSTGTDYFLLETRSRAKLAGNLPAMAPDLGERRIPLPHPVTGEDKEDHEILGRGLFLSPNLYAFVGRDLFATNSAEENILQAFIWVLLATLALALAGGVLLSRSFLGRMDAITRTCRAIITGRLSDRIADRGTRDEFDQLARTINAMLDRIAALMENVQQISSDIAHDLRTPLTRLRHRLEATYSDAVTIEDYRKTIEHAIGESEAILATFSALLRIGQLESTAAGVALNPVDFSGLLSELADIYSPVTEDSGHTLKTAIEPGVAIPGDRAMLSQLFANLIENAMTHSPTGGVICLRLERTQGGTLASVTDQGPGIPVAERERVFRRFYRLERSRSSSGNGLGLPLVAAIAHYHGASVALDDNNPGLRVVVNFGKTASPT